MTSSGHVLVPSMALLSEEEADQQQRLLTPLTEVSEEESEEDQHSIKSGVTSFLHHHLLCEKKISSSEDDAQEVQGIFWSNNSRSSSLAGFCRLFRLLLRSLLVLAVIGVVGGSIITAVGVLYPRAQVIVSKNNSKLLLNPHALAANSRLHKLKVWGFGATCVSLSILALLFVIPSLLCKASSANHEEDQESSLLIASSSSKKNNKNEEAKEEGGASTARIPVSSKVTSVQPTLQ